MKKFLFVIPFLGLIFCNNSFATQHNYTSLMTGSLSLPPYAEHSDNLGHWYRDFDSQYYNSSIFPNNSYGVDSSVQLWFRGDSWDDSYSSLKVYNSVNTYFAQEVYRQYTLDTINNVSACVVRPNDTFFPSSGGGTYSGSAYVFSSVARQTYTQLDQSYGSIKLGYGRSFFADGYNPVYDSFDNNSPSGSCYNKNDSNLYYFDNTYPTRLIYFKVGSWANNGLYGGNYTDMTTVNDNPFTLRPSQSYGLAMNDSTSVESSGVTYSGSFDFSKIFSNNFIPKFSKMEINLDTWDGRFHKEENLKQGRDLLWRFVFKFNGSFDWHSDVDSNNSFIHLQLNPVLPNKQLSNLQQYVDCIANLQVTNAPNDFGQNGEIKLLEVSCPVTLQFDYIDISPRLIIQGGDNDKYVWVTDDTWEFYTAYFVTDGDWTMGENVNNDYGAPIWDITNGMSSDTINDATDFFSSLVNMFSFAILPSNTPLGFIFGQFLNPEDNAVCAYIPGIASMIHSNEEYVCPWFDDDTRAITTPILSLFSSLLIFGFLMHWLGTGSGNFLEDSGGVGGGSRSNLPADGESYAIDSHGNVDHFKGYRRK